MEQLGSGRITCGQDVEFLAFERGTAKILSEPQVTGAQNITFGMAVLAPGKGPDRHNQPGAEEIIFIRRT